MNNDLISREALKKAFILKDDEKYYAIEVRNVIDNAPTVEPTFGLFRTMFCETCQAYATNRAIAKLADEYTRPQGEWIRKGDSKWHCSKCGAVPEFDGTTNTDKFNVTMSNKYCRLCGADMRKGGAV